MLQINTGKFHRRPLEHENKLTGVLYSNARLFTGISGEDVVATAAGTLTWAGRSGDIENIVFSMLERIEQTPQGPGKGALISHCIEPYLPHIAVVASFSTETTIWIEQAAVQRLMQGTRMPSGYGAPKEFVRQVFDINARILPPAKDELTSFIEGLIGLERKTYTRAMRAITLLTTGLHRLAEDISLSYALMVAAIETLTTDYLAPAPQWEHLDSRKRKLYGPVLKDLDDPTAETLKQTILKAEHAGAGHRFREFVASHLEDEFFRREKIGHSQQVNRYELIPALREAYNLRSKYVHEAKRLPDPIAHPHHHHEVTYIERVPALTHQGLYTLARQSILNFIAAAPKVETETYDYTYDRPGIVTMQMAPQYWVDRPLKDIRGAGRRIEGLLSQIEGIERQCDKAGMSDIRPITAEALKLLDGAKPEERQTFLIWLTLFYHHIPAEEQYNGWPELYVKHEAEIWKPNRLSIILTASFGFPSEWTINEHHAALESYFKKRVKPNGLQVPRLFEAAFCICLAERYRLEGDEENARSLLSQAADIDVGNAAYLAQLDNISMESPLLWDVLLLPPKDPAEKEAPSETQIPSAPKAKP